MLADITIDRYQDRAINFKADKYANWTLFMPGVGASAKIKNVDVRIEKPTDSNFP